MSTLMRSTSNANTEASSDTVYDVTNRGTFGATHVCVFNWTQNKGPRRLPCRSHELSSTGAVSLQLQPPEFNEGQDLKLRI